MAKVIENSYTDVIGLSNCYGCGACVVICPEEVFDLEMDAEGFYKPVAARSEKCIRCGLCSRTCAAISNPVTDGLTPLCCYASHSKDDTARRECSSGGTAYEIARQVCSDGGAAAVVRYNTGKRRAEHFSAHSHAELDGAKGSKYLQSNTVDGLREILKTDVAPKLITGTPCQIASVSKLLEIRNRRQDYVLMDFFCHGVPSYNIWKQYLRENPALLDSPDRVRWRDKSDGWQKSLCISAEKNGLTTFRAPLQRGNDFFFFFLRNYVLMSPCYKCPFRGAYSAADIRVGDLWGKKYQNNNKGITAVLTFTEAGQRILERSRVTLTEEDYGTVTEGQLCGNLPKPWVRGGVLKGLAAGRNLNYLRRRYAAAYRWSRKPANALKLIKGKLYGK